MRGKPARSSGTRAALPLGLPLLRQGELALNSKLPLPGETKAGSASKFPALARPASWFKPWMRVVEMSLTEPDATVICWDSVGIEEEAVVFFQKMEFWMIRGWLEPRPV